MACTMAGDVAWRRCLYRAGQPCEICKADWDMAYKHVSVRCEDHRLQVVEFGGRYFIERCLTFGGANSPTLYHLPASMQKSMAELKSGVDPRLNIMQLRDNCTLLNEEAQVLAWKINHYSNIFNGKFERCLIIHIVDEAKGKDDVVVVGKQARVQLTWWLINLRALSLEGNFIPDPEAWFPKTTLRLGSTSEGCGRTSSCRTR